MKFAISVKVFWYLGANFDYYYCILIFLFRSHNSTTKISRHFQKKGNIDGCSDYPINFKIGAERVTSRNQRPTKGPKEL